MKKNKMMRLASFLLIAVLVSTSAISGTYAKYVTTADAEDSARVAKWGVEVTATGNDAFAIKYDDETGDDGTKVVSDVKVVAPGTEGELGSVTITGDPEVMVNVVVEATLSLDGWEIDGVEYCPIVFTIGSATYGTAGTGATNVSADVDALETAIVQAVEALAATNVGTDVVLNRSVAVAWAWPFETGDDDAAKAANNVKDTKLGDLADDGYAPTIAFEVSVTVEQVD